MTTRTITFKRCDGCRRDQIDGEIEIVQSRPRRAWTYPGDQTLDLCMDCLRDGKWICQRCGTVHDKGFACEFVPL